MYPLEKKYGVSDNSIRKWIKFMKNINNVLWCNWQHVWF